MTETGSESLPDLDDLLQCPVCYEIPLGQIFQCNEGHHVCGSCKVRLEQCPVCRALFFGTRNYAMEELIASVRKLRAFKLGGKVTTGLPARSSTDAAAEVSEPNEPDEDDPEDSVNNFASRPDYRTPQACKGLFRCLCCKNGTSERLPSGRLLNHLRYYHAQDLIEGRSASGEYLQAWQIPTVPGRIVTAVRVADMGVFFLVIEITDGSLCAWLTMAASPWVAHEFCYTVTISGNDREAIFSDCVWSVRSCEGYLRKRGHCLSVTGLDARVLTSPANINSKLTVKRVSPDQLTQQTQPRAVLRVASRVTAPNLEPFLNDLQNGVERLSRAFATLGREADALVRSERVVRARIQNVEERTAAVADASRSEPDTSRSEPDASPSVSDASRPVRLTMTAPRRSPSASRPGSDAPRPAPSATRPSLMTPRPAPRLMSDAPRPAPLMTCPLTRSGFAPSPAQLWSYSPTSNPRPTRPQETSDPDPFENVVEVSRHESELTRNQRRRLRNRLRNALAAGEQTPAAPAPVSTFRAASPEVVRIGYLRVVETEPGPSGAATVSTARADPAAAPASSHTDNQSKANKKKRRPRHRR